MKRRSMKSWPGAWVGAIALAICVADGAGIYVAQMRLHNGPQFDERDEAYASASEVKPALRAPGARQELAVATPVRVALPPVAPVKVAAALPTPVAAPKPAPAPSKLAAARTPRAEPFLAPPRLEPVAAPAPVELATAVHAARHNAALRRAEVARTQRDHVPPTSQSFTAAFGGGATGALALPEPNFAAPATTALDAAKADALTPVDLPKADLGDSAAIGKAAAPAIDAVDPELPASVPAGN